MKIDGLFGSVAILLKSLLKSIVAMDSRPFITPRMRQENRQEWDRLWHLNQIELCPVCHEKPDIRDGPMNSDVPTRCTHWACVICWERIAHHDKRCPVCRDDLTNWFAWRSREDEDTEDEDADMAQSEDNGRYDFCEVCDEQMLGVVWYDEPFQNPSDNRRLYSACPTCRNRLGLRGAP